MKTTEIVVEQVLIGFVVMFIVAVLVAQGIPDIQWDKDTFQAVAISAGLLGAAYLIGIIYDRVADTLLKDLDQHARLRIALDHHDLSKQVTGRQKDPFPEDDIRLMVQTNSSTADYADYLRTRLRLTRALATLVPALVTVWLLIALIEETLWNWAIVTIGGVYLAVLICKLFAWSYEPPKTNQGRNANAKGLNAYIDSHKKKKDGRYKLTIGFLDVIHEPVYWGLLVLTLAGCIVVWFWSTSLILLSLPLIGLGLSLLVGWCWWRINRTFLLFLRAAEDNKHYFNSR